MQNKRNSGYTMPTAILIMLLLFAFGLGLLMFAAYNYNNAYKRYEKMQTYLYAKNLLDECEYFIMEGNMNEYLASVIDDVDSKLGDDLYGQKYSFKLELLDVDSDSGLLENPYNNDEINVEMFVSYKPVKSNSSLPANPYQYVSVGDWMDIEFRIKNTKGNNGEEMEYRFLSEFYCSHDFSKNSDGTIKPSVDLTSYDNMKWRPFQYTGNIYTK